MQFNGTNTSKTFVRLLLDFFCHFLENIQIDEEMQTKTHNTVLLVKQTIILLGQDSSAVSYCYEKNIPPYFHYCAYKTLNAISFLGILSQFGEISGELWIFFFTILHKKYITLGQKLFWRSNDNLIHLYDTVQVF